MLLQIWTDESYVYAATTSGLDIIDLDTEQRAHFLSRSGGYTSVWSTATEVFLGTPDEGLKYIDKDDITTVLPYVSSPDLTSDNVRYVHGNENKLICCTVGGVNVIKRDNLYVYGTSISGGQKCFITPTYEDCYFAISGTSSWELHRVDSPTGSWTSSNATYSTDGGFISGSTRINDFYVTERTSSSGTSNTLFVATDYSAYVYDEESGEYLLLTTVS
jgi:hypothetical protein